MERSTEIKKAGKYNASKIDVYDEADDDVIKATPVGTPNHPAWWCPTTDKPRSLRASNEEVAMGRKSVGTLDWDRSLAQRPPRPKAKRCGEATFVWHVRSERG